MQFPETPRGWEDVHGSAVRRLGEARDEQHRLATRLALAEGTADERAATEELAASRAGVAAREAWLVWVERGI